MSVNRQGNVITLKSSASLLIEYLDYAINMVLYQRDVCPKDQFDAVSHYGLPLLMSNDSRTVSKLKANFDFLQNLIPLLIPQIGVGLVLTDEATGKAFEHWQFEIVNEDLAKPNSSNHRKPVTKTRKSTNQIQDEIRQVMKQITASVSCLPLPPRSGCTWRMTVSVPSWVSVPPGGSFWTQENIENASHLQLRSFSTGLHQMQTSITYRDAARKM